MPIKTTNRIKFHTHTDKRTSLLKSLRKSGISFISDIPWGTHFCAFYETDNDLIEIATSYLRAGLENHEYCMWIVPNTIPPDMAINALEQAIPDFALYLPQLQIVTLTDLHEESGRFNQDNVAVKWQERVDHAHALGYEGFRLLGCTTWIRKNYWQEYMEYEPAVEKAIAPLQMMLLCPYLLGNCDKHDIVDIVSSHQFAFVKSRLDENAITSLAEYERTDLVGKMAASIAHEIRNPLAAVKGFIQLLQGKEELQKHDYYFSLMVEELDRANDIISEYLSLARDKTKNMKQQNLNDILRAIFPLLQATALKESKVVELALSEIDDILVDDKDIRQVILNLGRNALEAMQKGGVLEFKTYMDRNNVMLEVKDTGCGIPPEVMENLGKPFVTTKENGTGLGIPVSMRILDNYKATINIESSASGTTFIIAFPLQEI